MTLFHYQTWNWLAKKRWVSCRLFLAKKNMHRFQRIHVFEFSKVGLFRKSTVGALKVPMFFHIKNDAKLLGTTPSIKLRLVAAMVFFEAKMLALKYRCVQSSTIGS